MKRILELLAILNVVIALVSITMAIVRPEQWLEFLLTAGVAVVGAWIMLLGKATLQLKSDVESNGD